MGDPLLPSELICRTCLEPISQKRYPLTGELVFNIDLDVASMLEFCTFSKLDLSNNLPDSVCVSCFKTIGISYRFLKQFYDAQSKLLDQEPKDESNDNEEEETELILKEEDEKFDDFLSMHNYAETSKSVNENDEIKFEDTDIPIFMEQSIDKEEIIETESRNVKQVSKLFCYICPVCNKRFCHYKVFFSHVTNHNLSKIRCTRCTVQPVIELEDYFNHYINHHKNQCDICNKVLTTSFGYSYHMKLHRTVEKLKCPQTGCKRSFLTETMLKRHLKLHYISKTYSCHLCEATFKHKDNLNYHLKLHAGKRDHLCSVCGQAFYQAVTLRDHMNRHLGYKKFVCDICGKAFTVNGSLKKHSKRCSRKRNVLTIETL